MPGESSSASGSSESSEGEDDEQDQKENIPETMKTFGLKNVGLKSGVPNINPFNYSQVCNELKALYVAVTRPKIRLVIFDENREKRNPIQQFWRKLNLITEIDDFSNF